MTIITVRILAAKPTVIAAPMMVFLFNYTPGIGKQNHEPD